MTSVPARILHVDLSTGESRVENLSNADRLTWVGGVGLAARLLWRCSSGGADPLGPANPLVFAAGPFAGTPLPGGNRHAVATRSPLTGFIGDSLASGPFAAALRRAGFEALVITGRAPNLSCLLVADGAVSLRDAADLAGSSCPETEARLRELHGREAAVAAIGGAGERLVRYASIASAFGRHAGRTGTGAVMGAKRLKAVVVGGTGVVPVVYSAGLAERAAGLVARAAGPATAKYRLLGTVGNLAALNRLGALPTRNFRQATFERAEDVSGEELATANLSRVASCIGCPVACEHFYRTLDRGPAGAETALDYESLDSLGPLCGVADRDAILTAARLCDEYGMDTISAGGSIAWVMESFERGTITLADTGGIAPRFGDGEALVALVNQIGRREGFGRLLGEGVRRAAAAIGRGTEAWALHVKGLELPGYEPRGLKSLALGLAVSPRGACHNRAAAYEADLAGTVDRFSAEFARGRLVADGENQAAILDSLAICKFLRKCFADLHAEGAELFRLATGLPLGAESLRRVGERVCAQKKQINVREGWIRADDWLPPRLLSEALPDSDGVAAGERLTPAGLTLMIDGYYAARGWTSDGLIPSERLSELGIEPQD